MQMFHIGRRHFPLQQTVCVMAQAPKYADLRSHASGCGTPSNSPTSHSLLPVPHDPLHLALAATLSTNSVPSPTRAQFCSRACTMASQWMAERRPDAKGAYRATPISVVSKIFVYMSRYKQKNRVLLFQKPVYRFATRWKR